MREQPDSSWWADINPVAMLLARQWVLRTLDAHKAWDQLAGYMCKEAFPGGIHLWVADKNGPMGGTVCSMSSFGECSIAGMKATNPAAEVVVFDGAGHSIHNTNQAEFMAALKGIIARC